MDPYALIEKYYDKKSDLYVVLVAHSKQVMKKVLLIAQKHPELNIDKEFVVEAALLHDIGIFLCSAPRIFCVGTHQYIEHGYLGAELLRREGYERHALVCERHTGTGLTREMIELNNLPIPLGNYEPQSIEEQVICYADKFYSKSKLGVEHSIAKIVKDLSRYGASQVERFEQWHALFS